MGKAIASTALSLFVVLLFLTAGLVICGRSAFDAPGPLTQAICLEVPSGSTMRRVSADLDDKGALSYKTVFDIGVQYSDKAGQLKAGSHLVPAGASMAEILDLVTRGGQSTCGTEIIYRIGVTSSAVQVRTLDPATNRFVETAAFDLGTEPPAAFTEAAAAADTRQRVAVAEGVTSWQVVTGLNAIDALATDVTDIPAEGSLAPDSYEFAGDATVQSILDRMAAAQVQILAEEWANRAADLPITTPDEALVLASLVEKETGVADERALVASVFVNRLDQGIRLQTDPSVIYGLTNGEGVLGRGLRQSELRRDTPYNTYVNAGLPPTPIANPGRDAIHAALNPAETKFLYFVADGTGGHAFAETLREHNANVARWRAIEQQNGN